MNRSRRIALGVVLALGVVAATPAPAYADPVCVYVNDTPSDCSSDTYVRVTTESNVCAPHDVVCRPTRS
jgi:hypothetical protein